MFLTSVILVRRFRGSYHFTLLLSGLALCLMDPRWLASCLPGIMSSFQKKRKWKKKNDAASVQKSKSFPKSFRRAVTGKYNQNMSILQLSLFLTLKLCITKFQQVVGRSLKTGFSSGSVFHSICDFTQVCKSFWTFISSF